MSTWVTPPARSEAGLSSSARLNSIIDARYSHLREPHPSQGLFLRMAGLLRQAGFIDEAEACLNEGQNIPACQHRKFTTEAVSPEGYRSWNLRR
jgi:hypothetical protein